MQKIISYGTVFLLLAMLCTSCNTKKSQLPPLKETFAKKDKNPFGSYVFYNQLKQVFYQNELNNKKENFETVWRQISDTASVYVIISKNLFLSEAGQKAMLDYVREGNTLFISSNNIDSSLLDSLGCSVNGNAPAYEGLENMKYTSVALDATYYIDTSVYAYFYFPLAGFFNKYDTTITNVLGANDNGKPNYLEVFYGKGKFYLHCEPRALGNYFLLQKNNSQYLQRLFAFTGTRPEHVYWDDYYNKKNYPQQGNKSGIQLLLQYPATARALWLVLLLLVVYILFGGKRRQRIVETVPPNTNTTAAFTETVGHLYLQKKDNRNIADKMIMYFMEHIRKQYYLNTSEVNDIFISTLSRKANVTKEATEDLFRSIKLVHNSFEITDQQLLLLNQQIDIFYKNKI